MTPKPSEAELAELDVIAEKVLRGNPTAVDMVTRHLALPGLLARIRELEKKDVVRDRSLECYRTFTREHMPELREYRDALADMETRAEAAEKRVADLVDFIATGDFTDDARRQAIAKAETALAGAEAGERKPVPATEHYSGECPTCGNACRCAGCKAAP